MSKQAVKRPKGNSRPQKFAKQIDDRIDNTRRRDVLTMRQQTIDAFILWMHHELGFGPERMKLFFNTFEKYEEWMSQLLITDAKCDKTLEYSKAKLDQALQQGVAPEDMLEYDIRYDFGI